MMGKDSMIHDGGVTITGPEDFKPYFDRLQSAFSDIHVEVLKTLAEDEWVCLRWVVTMRHTGDSLGVPATGKHLRAAGMSMSRMVGWLARESLAELGHLHGRQLTPEPTRSRAVRPRSLRTWFHTPAARAGW